MTEADLREVVEDLKEAEITKDSKRTDL